MTKRNTTLPALELSARMTLDELLEDKKLYDMENVAEITGLCVRYIRQLCRTGKIDHHKLLGRYYLTPAETAKLLTPVRRKTKS